MTEGELKRLADGGGGPELSAGIALARDEGPSAEQRARLRAKLGLPVEAPAGKSEPSSASSVEPPASSAAMKSLLAKLGVSAAILAVAGTAYWTWLPRQAAPRALNEAPRAEPVSARPPPAALIAPATAEPALRAEPARSRAMPRREAKKPAEPASEVAAADPTAELTLLRRARSHVRSAPARALALVAEHEQRFASGVLAEEREVIAIEALLLSGERAAAEARAAAFTARYPQSAHLRRVRVLLSDPDVSDQGSRVPATPTR